MSKRSSGARSKAEPSPAIDFAAAARDRQLAALDRQRAAELLASSYRDELTGVLTRRAGRMLLAAEIERAHRTGVSLAVVFADVDGLKQANDTRGHAHGDALLSAVAASLRSSLRGYDLVIRYGGDEFVCALPGGNADNAVHRINRSRIELGRAFGGASFSAGFAELRSGENVDDVVGRADLDLYNRRTLARRTIGRRTPDRVTPAPAPHRRHVLLSDVGCGNCGDRLPLATFVVKGDEYGTRSADCPGCGETTVIRLVRRRTR